MKKQLLLVLTILTSFTCVISAQAQNKPNIIPKFINPKQATQITLPSDGKPFIPPGLERSKQPIEGGTRGIPTGIDNRIPMLSNKYPWSAIGRVQGSNYHCTGTLIAPNLVLTNSHCVIDPETGVLSKSIKFMPNVIDGKYQDIAEVEQVIYGTDFKGGDKDWQNDWAIMKINQPLGRKYGYLGLKSLPTSALVQNRRGFYFVGYSRDFPNDRYKQYFNAGAGWTASYESGCSIVGEESGSLLHDCATAGGSSGGAIIAEINGEPYIIALNNAEVKNLKTGQDIINFAVKISTIEQALKRN